MLGGLGHETIDQWKETMQSIPRREYGWLEAQANSFAGHLLVPTAELHDHCETCLTALRENDLDPTEEGVQLWAEKHLGGIFRASSQTVHIRIEREHLWPPVSN